MRINTVVGVGYLVFLCLPSWCVCAQQPDSTLLQNPPAASQSLASKQPLSTENAVLSPLREVPNPAFAVGEKLEYVIRYGRIVAGNSRLSIPETVEVNGNPSYHIISEAWSNAFFSKFYRVDDRIESFTDVEGIFSWQFSKRLREGSFRSNQDVFFDQVNHRAITGKDTLAVPPFVQDILSAMYYVRTLDFAPGDTLYVDNHSDNMNFPLMLVVHRRERVNVKAGKFDCLVVEPFLRSPGLFKQKGRIVVHLSDDRRKLPVLMTSQIYVKSFNLGAVVAELENAEGVLAK